MKLFIAFFTLLPLLASADLGHSSSHTSDCEGISVVRKRVPLPTNTSAIIYREFRSGFEVVTQLLLDRQHDFGASVVFGGDDDGFEAAIQFAGNAGSQREAFINRIASYAKLRWLGVSPKAALAFATATEDKTPENIPEKDAKVIRDASPGIPVSALRPLTTSPLAMPWLDGSSGAYIFIDDEVSFIFQPHKATIYKGGAAPTQGWVCSPPYIIDSAEFSPTSAPRIRSIARSVQKRLAPTRDSDRHPATTYWHELRKKLQSAGITWRTPPELNSEIVWE